MRTGITAPQGNGSPHWRADALLVCSDVLALDNPPIRGGDSTPSGHARSLQAAVRAARERRGECARGQIVG